MTPFEQQALAGRLAAQDALIGLLMTIAVRSGAVAPQELAEAIRAAAPTGGAPWERAAAAILRDRAGAATSA